MTYTNKNVSIIEYESPRKTGSIRNAICATSWSEKIDEAKESSYKAVMRIFRGTDELPWFKDLAYYNGSSDMWRHLEEIRGDDMKFIFVLLGKANPANISHQRIMLETKTV